MKNREQLEVLTKKFIQDFIQLSGEESATYAINAILPEVMYPLLPEYKEPTTSIFMPMSYFETNMAKEGVKNRLKGWTSDLAEIVSKLEGGSNMDFDRFRFENLRVFEKCEEKFYITDYKTLACATRLVRVKGKSFDIISTTNLFKGTVELVYRPVDELEVGMSPIESVFLYCGKTCIFTWRIFEENEEYCINDSVDSQYIKDLNSFYLYTKTY